MTITTAPSSINADTIVFAEGRGVVGRIRPVGNAFRVMDAGGHAQLALKSTYRQALAVYKYGL